MSTLQFALMGAYALLAGGVSWLVGAEAGHEAQLYALPLIALGGFIVGLLSVALR